jgi:pSer/pThr/pTyr-binding forkhead associated (FHA) protein
MTDDKSKKDAPENNASDREISPSGRVTKFQTGKLNLETILTYITDTQEKDKQQPEQPVVVEEHHELVLLIAGIAERRKMTRSFTLTLGRATPDDSLETLLDLTSHGAARRGVSRQHARLYIENEELYVVDLGSTNGTYLRGEKLEPNQPAKLKRGDEMMLGHLLIQTLFEDPVFTGGTGALTGGAPAQKPETATEESPNIFSALIDDATEKPDAQADEPQNTGVSTDKIDPVNDKKSDAATGKSSK